MGRPRTIWSGSWAVSAARKSAKDLREYGATLWTFAKVENVEPANNAAERAGRKGVLWREGSFGSHGAEGSLFAERMTPATQPEYGPSLQKRPAARRHPSRGDPDAPGFSSSTQTFPPPGTVIPYIQTGKWEPPGTARLVRLTCKVTGAAGGTHGDNVVVQNDFISLDVDFSCEMKED